ncbi:MAG: hypothetical protein ABSC91_04980 [Candidatus Bathyarchaeia archaeon]
MKRKYGTPPSMAGSSHSYVQSHARTYLVVPDEQQQVGYRVA